MDSVRHSNIHNISELLSKLRNGPSNPTALNYIRDSICETYSTEDMLQKVKHFALGMVSLGLKKGDRVGILAQPSPLWSITDMAIILAGGITVPLFANISEENFIFEVTQTEIKILLVSDPLPWEMYYRHRDLFHTVIALDEPPIKDRIISVQEVFALGQKMDEKEPKRYPEMEASIKDGDIATIIYTSGSTGIPKGVEITHRALLFVTNYKAFNYSLNDRYLNILPLAHVFGRSLNFFMLFSGVSVYYLNDQKNFSTICRKIHPTVLVVVPRVLERIYSKMLTKVQQQDFMKRKIGLWAFELANLEEDSLFKHLFHPIVDKIVYSTLREAIGGSVNVVISGGAPLNSHLCHFFLEIGVPIYEGWGMTEAATVTINNPKQRKIGTVGKPLPEMEIALSPEGEVLVKGPVVMKGYYLNPESTSQVFDKDGWFHTGDRGWVDDEGFLTLTGRIKELFKTSTGEYVVPIPIEQAICNAPFIDFAMVIADDRKFTSCLLFPDFEVLHSLKASHQMGNLTDEEFLNSEFVKKEMDNLINSVNEHLNHWEKVRRYRFIQQPLSIEGGELTPSMKIKRDVVAKKYSAVIDSMYEEGSL